MKLFYFETVSNSTYIHMDGMLRRITENTFYNLFDSLMKPYKYQRFTLEEAPYPVGWPLPDNARLVKEGGLIYLEDIYPWSADKIILRPVINPMKGVDINWDFVKFLPADPTYGVPISLSDDRNIKAAQNLAGLIEIYNHFLHSENLNPFFYYMLPHYPDSNKMSYRQLIEKQINEARQFLIRLALPERFAIRHTALQ